MRQRQAKLGLMMQNIARAGLLELEAKIKGGLPHGCSAEELFALAGVGFQMKEPTPTYNPKDVPRRLRGVSGLHELVMTPHCGIYFLCLGDELVYIGQSVDINARALGHRHGGPRKKQYDRIFFVRVPREQLDTIEAQFINLFKPKLNKHLSHPHRREPR